MASRRQNRSTGNRPTTRRNLEPVADLRPVGADGSKPPYLDLQLKQKLKILALANALPMVVGLGIVLGWTMGVIEFSISEHRLLFTVMIMLCSLVLIGCCWWVLFPFSVWLRAYPTWFYHHESKIIWALPTLAAWALWFVLWVSCMALTLFSLWLIASAAMDLFGRM